MHFCGGSGPISVRCNIFCYIEYFAQLDAQYNYHHNVGDKENISNNVQRSDMQVRFPPGADVEGICLLNILLLNQLISLICPIDVPQNAARSIETKERYSRKVFVGGLPHGIDEGEIMKNFCRFGRLAVHWPQKHKSQSRFPPNGYVFLLFHEELSVKALVDTCAHEDGKFYLCVSRPTNKDKRVEVRPWLLSDSNFVFNKEMPMDARKTVFLGGIPRTLSAAELARFMELKFGGPVCFAAIDTDVQWKYPKGWGRVTFLCQDNYIAALGHPSILLKHGDIEKRVEVKPYILDDQMCDSCKGSLCGGGAAKCFCSDITCLKYYCEHCWAIIHSQCDRGSHKPLVKKRSDRPRT